MYQTYIPNTNFAKTTRIHCYLGYNCNIECSFCTNRLFELKPTKQIVNKTISTIRQLDFDHDDTVIHLSGGELYQDDFDIQLYQPLLELYPDVCKSTITNLMYNKLDRCIDLWRWYNVEVWTSYDSRGRFKTKQLFDVWFSNLQKLVNCGIDPIINIIATPFVSNDPVVNQLTDQYRTFFSPLENKQGRVTLINLYKQLIDQYKCLNVKTANYQCKVININDTYVDNFCNIAIVTDHL